MTRRLIQISSSFLFAILLYTSSSAQRTLSDTLTLPEVRVHTAYGMKLGSIGKNVDIIKRQQIEQLGLSSVDAILRTFTGIEVISRGVNGAQNDLSIRGSSFNQVLVLVDGLRMNDPLTGHFSMYTLAQTLEIERIEVINGASSTLYGTEALGGVINIITKKMLNLMM